MKKIIGFLFIMLMSLNVYGASDVSINSLSLQEDKVVLSGSVTDFSENDLVTVMATEYINDSYDLNTVVYMDCFELTEKDFTTEFYLSDEAIKGKSYIIRVGATGVDSSTYGILLYKDEQVEILYGDANLDGLLTAEDSALVLQYVMNSDVVDFDEVQLKTAKVAGNDYISATDAAFILAKVLNNDMKFPIE